MKKVVAIMGSPRKSKNTDTILDKVLEGINSTDVEVKKIYLRDLNISPCIGCGFCEKEGKCYARDDMDELYEDFDKSDGIIIASPLYFNTVSSLTKIMIDRCQVYWSSKYVLKDPSIDVNKKRIGMFICVGGAPYSDDHFKAATPVMELFFKSVNTQYKYNLLVSNTDKVPTWERKDKMKEAYNMGINFLNI